MFSAVARIIKDERCVYLLKQKAEVDKANLGLDISSPNLAKSKLKKFCDITLHAYSSKLLFVVMT